MKSEDKKMMTAAYKQRAVIGGICAIKNIKTGRTLLVDTQDITGSRNRFEFSRQTGSAVSMIIQTDWQTYGFDSFSFEVLEELKKSETQTLKEFAEDLKILKEMWREKFSVDQLY